VKPAPSNLSAFAVPLAGSTLVEASAGTGKTHTITSLFVRLVLERGLPVREILVVTFTEAATAELRDRIRRRLRIACDALDGRPTPSDPELTAYAKGIAPSEREAHRARARKALRELDLAAISTIHGFCLRMLQEHAFESGARFGLELMGDPSALVREVADDYWASRIYDLEPSLYALRDKEFTLEISRSIIAKLAQRPADLTVLPLAAPLDPQALKVALDPAFDSARKAWVKHRAAVRSLLLGSKDALSQAAGKYTPDALEADCEELDGYFAQERPSFTSPWSLSKLTRGRLAEGTKKNKVTPDHAFFGHAEKLEGLLTQAANGLVAGLRRGAVDYVRAELPRRKQALGVQSFEDLLFSLDAALQGPRGLELRRRIQGRFGAALIDEFQDTDPVQYRIFRSLFDGKEAPLFLVGDPKQSIYAFRGADVFSYTAASEAADASYTLHENRRSDPSLVKAVNTLFAGANEPFMLDAIGFHRVIAHEKKDRLVLPGGDTGARFDILFVPRPPEVKTLGKGTLDRELPAMIASEISRFLASGAQIDGRPVVPGDIAVLTRKNVQARNTQAALRELQIPTALQSEESVFHSSEAEEVELLLRAMLEPTRSGTVRTALATTVAGLSANQILTFDSDELEWDRWSEQFRSWQAHWTEHGFVHAYRKMLTDLGAEKRLLALVDGERRMTNLLHLGELLHGTAVRERLGPTALVRWLGLMRADERPNAELGAEASELRLESDAHAVKLLTIHKSKGLEFPIVYCPFLWDILLPDESHVAIPFHDAADGNRLVIDVVPEKGGASLEAATKECRAENQRLLYVALTRARHRCSIVWGGVNQAECSALAYTLHQPKSAPAGELPDAAAARYKGLDDAGLRRDLAKLVAAAGGTIAVVDLVATPGVPYVEKERSALALRARTFERAYVDRRFRVGSFTSLTADRSAVSQPESQGRDRDEVEERASLAPPPATTPASPTPVLLHELPRGTKPGTMLHSILEEHDFTSADETALAALVAEKLEGAGYSNAEWGEVLVRGVQAMLATPLDDAGLTLASVTRTRRADELEFVFPVAKGKTVLTAAKMAKALAAHRGAHVPESYPERVRELGFELRGFLKGYIDLVFEHEGRFYVVDYKSNHLGANVEDYRPAKLAVAMSHHDYFLQYHLYTVAVHRWLGRRLRGYDYDRHFGGVLYLFARGMSPDHPAQTGIFHDRPSRELVVALSEAARG
jgi:exodeoxyribonuclease V beta subunit